MVLLTPDHQGLPDVERINDALAGDDDTPVSFHCSFSKFDYELNVTAVVLKHWCWNDRLGRW